MFIVGILLDIFVLLLFLLPLIFGLVWRWFEKSHEGSRRREIGVLLRLFFFHGWWVLTLMISIENFFVPNINDFAVAIIITSYFSAFIYLGYFFRPIEWTRRILASA